VQQYVQKMFDAAVTVAEKLEGAVEGAIIQLNGSLRHSL
jgi:hypothetical protein